ncbi:A24 family peptidase [Tautonia sociabilis]|uniref:Prepilin peptidase n=1 Tax=Tautonia sociabilis TaxID=2080755 RepID=A0A432MHV7_9BACT|nr:A24 family peptidase [Tautonia sociabilis]RUL86724.1 prepilin peptidase [Tautonia sociabilis]
MTFTLPIGAAWVVSAAMTYGAWIDGKERRVPNWLTLPMALCGLSFWAGKAGAEGLVWSALGLVVGLVFLGLLFWYGGVGGGDVKLFAGFGAWVGPSVALNALAAGAIVGGIMALAMVAQSGQWGRHWRTAREIVQEIATVRHPDKVSELAAARKPTLRLLPYGVPLTIGSVGYLAWSGLLH